MKKRLLGLMIAITICIITLVPVGVLAEKVTLLSDDFEGATSVFTTRPRTATLPYLSSEIRQQSAANRAWRLSMGDGTPDGNKFVECYTKDYSSYAFPSNVEDIIYKAEIWIVNNNNMPDQVYYGMNFGYKDRIMRLRFSWDTKQILYQWTTGGSETALPQAFSSGTWYRVKVIYHTASETCDIYINGVVQSMGYSTVTWTDTSVSVNGHNPLIKFNLVTKTATSPLSLTNPIRVNFDNVKVSYTQQAAPVTGDSSNIALQIATLLVSLSCAFLLIRMLKKRSA